MSLLRTSLNSNDLQCSPPVREKRIALVGNIEKAFLNVAVAEEDRLGGQFRRRESRIDVIAVLSCGVWSQC